MFNILLTITRRLHFSEWKLVHCRIFGVLLKWPLLFFFCARQMLLVRRST